MRRIADRAEAHPRGRRDPSASSRPARRPLLAGKDKPLIEDAAWLVLDGARLLEGAGVEGAQAFAARLQQVLEKALGGGGLPRGSPCRRAGLAVQAAAKTARSTACGRSIKRNNAFG